MAKQTLNYSFKNAEISLEENTITEFKSEEIKVYVFSDVIRKFEGEGKKVNLTIQESSELDTEVDGE